MVAKGLLPPRLCGGLKPLQVDEEHVRAALQDAGAAQVLQFCIAQARSAKEISGSTGIPVVTVYRHVKRLAGQGLLVVERSALASTGKPYDLYRCPLASAGLAITADGLRVFWKAQRGMSDRLHGLWKQMEQRK